MVQNAQTPPGFLDCSQVYFSPTVLLFLIPVRCVNLLGPVCGTEAGRLLPLSLHSCHLSMQHLPILAKRYSRMHYKSWLGAELDVFNQLGPACEIRAQSDNAALGRALAWSSRARGISEESEIKPRSATRANGPPYDGPTPAQVCFTAAGMTANPGGRLGPREKRTIN